MWAENETRTRDPNLGKVVLYQLSYFRKISEEEETRTPTSQLTLPPQSSASTNSATSPVMFCSSFPCSSCPEQDSNLHVVKHSHLKRARLPFRHLGLGKFLSGKRDSNSRPQPWQGCALPTELFPQGIFRKACASCWNASAKVRYFLEWAKEMRNFFAWGWIFCFLRG